MTSLQAHLLIASPHLQDTNFYKGVVLLIEHSPQGALGILLNRPLEMTLGDAWPEELTSIHVDQKVLWGGPVSGPVIVVHRLEEYSEREILPGIHLATHRHYLTPIVSRDDSQFLIVTGYAGWSQGQLESELSQGSWLSIRATPDTVFSHANDLWERVTQAIGEPTIRSILKNAPRPSDPQHN